MIIPKHTNQRRMSSSGATKLAFQLMQNEFQNVYFSGLLLAACSNSSILCYNTLMVSTNIHNGLAPAPGSRRILGGITPISEELIKKGGGGKKKLQSL